MLQDLDILADRIGQLVKQSRQLQAERQELLARLRSLEAERDALREQAQRQQSEFATMSASLASHQSTVADIQAQSEQMQLELNARIDQAQAHSQQLQMDLTNEQAASNVLREVAALARDQVGAVLMRLPGGQHPGGQQAQD